jgi:hypothetical protein
MSRCKQSFAWPPFRSLLNRCLLRPAAAGLRRAKEVLNRFREQVQPTRRPHTHALLQRKSVKQCDRYIIAAEIGIDLRPLGRVLFPDIGGLGFTDGDKPLADVDSKEMNPVLLQVERINDSIVADASTKTVRSFQPMMRKRCETQTDFINLRFDARPKSWWQLKKDRVETRVVNLRRRTHEPSGSRTRALFPSAMSCSACSTARSNSGVNCSSSSIRSSSHSRI